MDDFKPVQPNKRLVIEFDDGPEAPAQLEVPTAPLPAAAPVMAMPPLQPPTAPLLPPVAPPAPRAVSGQTYWASWGARLGAAIIDGLLALVVCLVVAALVGAGIGASASDGTSEGAAMAGLGGLLGGLLAYTVISLLWTLLYAPLTMCRQGEHNGQTLGKQAVGIRVVRLDGAPVTAGTAVMRELVMKGVIGFVSTFLFFIPMAVDYLWPLWDDRSQALHDKGANTGVVDA